MGLPANPMDELLQKLEDLPPLPDTCDRLDALLRDPNSTPNQLAAVIDTDAALSTIILKLANSAYYNLPGSVSSVQRAVCFMGFSAIHQLALCLYSGRQLKTLGNPPPEWLNQHSSAVANLAESLKGRLGIPATQSLYSAGLLHDLGRITMNAILPDKFNQLVEAVAKGAPAGLELEKNLFGLDHQEVGDALAKKWRYPPLLRMVLGDHHGPGRAVQDKIETQAQKITDLIAIADTWVYHLSRPGMLAAPPPAVDAQRTERTGLPAVPPEAERELLANQLDGGMDLFD